MLPKVEVTVEVEVRSTEDPEKVRMAVLNIFPNLSFAVEEGGRDFSLIGKGESIEVLNEFRILIDREKICNAARRVLRSSTTDGRATFYLNKQVAAVKRLSFCEPYGESPLGPIAVTIDSDRLGEIIDWLAPRVADGQSRRGIPSTLKSSATMTSGKMRRARSRKQLSSR